MYNRVSHVYLVTFVFTVLVVFMFSSGHVLAGQDDASVDKVRLGFNAAYNDNNARALARLLDRNAVWMPPGEPTIVGRDKIEARYKNFFTKVQSKFELKAGDIQSCGGWASISGDWARTDTPRTGGAPMRVAGHYLLILKKQTDGTWKIARDIWNELAKPR